MRAAAALLAATAGAAAAGAPPARSWLDPSAPVLQRVDALLAEMTQAEKLAQLARPQWDPALAATGVGLLEFPAFTANASSATDVVRARNAAQRALLAAGPGARLGLPAAFRLFSIHGSEAFGVTFPEGPGLGASWDPELVADVAAAMAAEGAALGADMAFFVIHMIADARFGRQQEGFSEEPVLTGALAAACVRGAHGAAGVVPPDAYLVPPPASPDAGGATGVLAALFKHLGAYGAAAGGLNGGRADVPEHTVRESYLRPWRRAAAAGSRGLMPSHNSVLNAPAHASTWLLRDRIRGELNQSLALIVSDTGDVAALGPGGFRVCATDAACAARALNAGVDIEQVPGALYQALPAAIAQGLTSQAAVDAAVRRVLLHKFSTRLFDAPFTNESLAAAVVNSAPHRALAQRAAEQGAVLLVNRRGLLPLRDDGSLRVAVVGPNGGCGAGGSGAGTLPLCDAQAAMLGNYASAGAPPPTGVATVAQALADAGGGGRGPASVVFARGSNIDDTDGSLLPAAVAAAAAADVVVAVLGDSTSSCGESEDRDSLDLPGGQLALLAALVATGKPLVLVLVAGRTATFGAQDGNPLLAGVGALLMAWRPGSMGGPALADLLLGRANPSGRLPMSWLRTAGQAGSGASPWLQERVAIFGGGPPVGAEGRRYGSYWHAGNPTSPLFAFGEGLSYTNFSYGNLSVAVAPPGSANASAFPVTVRLTVTNTGGRAGSSVVQAYVQDPVGATLTVRPWKRLVGFARVPDVPPGGSVALELPLRGDDLAAVDDAMALALLPGAYTLSVGESSVADAGLTAVFEL